MLQIGLKFVLESSLGLSFVKLQSLFPSAEITGMYHHIQFTCLFLNVLKNKYSKSFSSFNAKQICQIVNLILMRVFPWHEKINFNRLKIVLEPSLLKLPRASVYVGGNLYPIYQGKAQLYVIKTMGVFLVHSPHCGVSGRVKI